MELNQQIAALLNEGDEEDLVELKSLQQQLSICYLQASQLEFRQNLQAALEFHGVAQDVSTCSDSLPCLQVGQTICTKLL